MLNSLGFRDVRDIDAEPEASSGAKERLREDVQIWDRSPTLLVEIKGIGGLPREAASLQVAKYLVPRMREWDRRDIQGLSIVNHQRNLPALDRNNTSVFQDDVLANAEQQGFGLMTTWDLFRLARGFVRNNWNPEHVMDVLYETGRVDATPSHYDYVGVVDGYWDQPGAFGLRIEVGTVTTGDILAYELPVEFLEERVESLQLDGQPIEQASVGNHVGVKTSLTKQQARNQTRVFRVELSN